LSKPLAQTSSWKKSPWAVTGVVILFYIGVTLLFLRDNNHNFRDFATVGELFITKSEVSPVIKKDPSFNYLYGGYDGQFVYFIALDPLNARYYVDLPSYRYTRILYPITARILAFGIPEFISFTLVLTNILAIAAGTFLIAQWFRKKGLSVWLSLVYALYIGQFYAFTHDLTEVMAYSLVVGGIYFYNQTPRKLWISALLFALAGLTRETTLVFPVILAIWLFWEELKTSPGKRGRLLLRPFIIGSAVVPTILWQGFLYLWLGNIGLSSGTGLEKIPFIGLINLFPWSGYVIQVIIFAVIPGLICFGAGVRYLLQGSREAQVVLLLINVVLFIFLLPQESLVELRAASRIMMGVVVSAIFCLPEVARKTKKNTLKIPYWFFVCASFWICASVLYLLTQLIYGTIIVDRIAK